MKEEDLASRLAQEYLSFWMENWRQVGQIWDPQGEILKSFSQMGWGLAAMAQHTPSPFLTARNPGRALSMHMGITLTLWGSAQQALWGIASGKLPLGDQAATNKLQQKLNDVGVDRIQQALGNLVFKQTQEMGEGILKYLMNTTQREEPDTRVVWERGKSQLLDFAPDKGGIPIFLIPSMINRPYIMDIFPDHSFIRHLGTEGFKPYVLDWGDPDSEECTFGLDEYYSHRLEPAFAALEAQTSQTPPVIGYCMGGMMALALAQRHPEIQKAAFIATPWDFKEHQEIPLTLVDFLKGPLSTGDLFPPEVLQVLFYGLNPQGIYKKFQKLAALSPEDREAQEMVQVEDWVNDGVALPSKVVDVCFQNWFQLNQPAKGEWSLAGKLVNPQEVQAKTLVASAHYDRIVPMGSSNALAQQLTNAQWWALPFSHTGLMTHRDAVDQFWRPLASWFKGGEG